MGRWAYTFHVAPTSSPPEAILSHSWAHLGRTWAHLGRSWPYLDPSWAILGRSWGHLGPSWGHLGGLGEGAKWRFHSGHLQKMRRWRCKLYVVVKSYLQAVILIHLGLVSAIFEICLQALRLATLSALPVPMLRQVYLQGLYGALNGDFARDILKKWEDGDIHSMLLRRLPLKRPS